MMKKINTLFALCMLCFGSVSSADAAPVYQDKKCKEIMQEHPVEFDITYDFGNLEYDRSKTAQEIESIFVKNNQKAHENGKVQGLTILKGYYKLSAIIASEKMRGLYSCYYPTKITLHLGYKDSVMYIAKELKEKTCEYERTLRHEYTHLRFGYLGLAMQVMTAQNNMQNLINDIGPLATIKKKELAETELMKKYENRFLSVYQAIEQIIKDQNAKIDTLENYTEESKLCKSI